MASESLPADLRKTVPAHDMRSLSPRREDAQSTLRHVKRAPCSPKISLI